ncbi:MAG TPA: type II toxin-antitoxin system VapC family toxin [Roseiarcus sp.]|nr:type II toxin-antitoxin system VapC family toxin [Roseiarcus sp.]
MALVIDASVAVGWFVPAQATALTDAALTAVSEAGGVAPPHFAIEVLRVLRRCERRGHMPLKAISASLRELENLGLAIDEADPISRLAEIHRLSQRTSLAVADAAYLDVAARSNIPLATRDSALARAAQSIGVPLFQP